MMYRRCIGMSMVEALAALAITALVCGACAMLLAGLQKQSAHDRHLPTASPWRNALERIIEQDMQQAQTHTLTGPQQLHLTRSVRGETLQITYWISEDMRLFRSLAEAPPELLASHVSAFSEGAGTISLLFDQGPALQVYAWPAQVRRWEP